MEKFFITYNNPDSESNGHRFLVREDQYYPNHYLIADGKSHVGGGTLAKKYCTRDFDLKQVLTFEQLKQFFSLTTEFIVSRDDKDLPDTYKVTLRSSSLRIYQPTLQTLIRHIQQLSWNEAKGIN